MKRIYQLNKHVLLLFCAMLFLSACGGGGNSSSDNPNKPKDQKQAAWGETKWDDGTVWK